MNNKTIVSLARIFSGTALLITHALTGVNGLVVSVAILLLGLPVEGLMKGDSKNE